MQRNNNDDKAIPVVDLKEESAEVDLLNACKTVGFCYITNHDIPLENIEEAFAAMAEFFSLPIKEKEKLLPFEGFRGYYQLCQEVTLGLKDWHEGVDMIAPLSEAEGCWESLPSQEERAKHPLLCSTNELLDKEKMCGNQSAERLQKAIRTHWESCQKLGMKLMQMFVRGLEGTGATISADFFAEEPFCITRLLHYPPYGPNDHSEDVGIGVGEHTDYGCLTLLLQDEVGGLQVKNRNGEWYDVRPIPGAFVINLGDALAAWSGGILKATPHRVLTNPTKRRFSLPFFFEPRYNQLIEPLQQTYGAYLTGKYQQSFPSSQEKK